jgi:hypothetical protein
MLQGCLDLGLIRLRLGRKVTGMSCTYSVMYNIWRAFSYLYGLLLLKLWTYYRKESIVVVIVVIALIIVMDDFDEFDKRTARAVALHREIRRRLRETGHSASNTVERCYQHPGRTMKAGPMIRVGSNRRNK